MFRTLCGTNSTSTLHSPENRTEEKPRELEGRGRIPPRPAVVHMGIVDMERDCGRYSGCHTQDASCAVMTLGPRNRSAMKFGS